MNPRVWWYTARAGGLVAFGLVTVSVLWGLLLSSRLLGRKPAPKWLLDLHRMLGGLAVVFTGIHIAGLVADTYVHFGWADVLLPFASKWHPIPVAIGVVSLYLLAAVELTSLLSRFLSRRAWKAVHGLSYPLFWLSSIHGATAGTDARNGLFRIASVSAIAAVTILTVVRLVRSPRSPRSRRSVREPATPVATFG